MPLPQPDREDTVRVVAGHVIGVVDTIEAAGIKREAVIAGIEMALRRLKGEPDRTAN